MTTQTQVLSFWIVAFERIVEHTYVFIQHFGTTKLGEILFITEKVDCVIRKRILKLRILSFPIFFYHFK